MKLKLILAALSPLLFACGFALTLLGQGRLDKSTIRRTPGLGALVGGEAAPVDSGAETADPAATPGQESSDDASAEKSALAGVFDLPRPYEAEELQELVQDLQRAREHHDRRRQELERRLKEVAQLEADLEVRRREMEQLMKSVADSEGRVIAAREQEAKLQTHLSDAESERLRPAAQSYERIQPQVAAALLVELPAHEAVKLMAMMKPKKVSKVLEALPPTTAADLTRRLARLVRDPLGGEK